MAREKDADIEDIVGQCWVAFGQGAGSMKVSREAIAAGRKHYTDYFSNHIATWDDDSLQMLEFVQAAGRLAAHLATFEGFAVIGPRHLQRATVKIFRKAEERHFAMGDCPYCAE
jgi:hypothetical protein